MIRKIILLVLLRLVGRSVLWRVSRALFMHARAESSGAINDGEHLVQRDLLVACASQAIHPVVFDVGANIGDWTSSLLQIRKSIDSPEKIQIHCFEPVPSTFSILTNRLKEENSGALISFVQKACSNQNANTEMYVFSDGAGTNSLYGDFKLPKTRRILVEKITVDSYCLLHSISTISYLKVDTEGHDAEVLIGASRMFREHRIMVFQFEYNHRWVMARHFLLDVFQFAEGLPYSIGKITTDAIELYDEWHPELERFFHGNYVLIRNDVLTWFKTRRGAFDDSNTYVADISV